MNHNALNQTLSSQTLGNGHTAAPMVTGAQVMQFLGSLAQAGGSGAGMADSVMRLMQQVPEVKPDIIRQLAPLVEMAAPRETQVHRALDNVCVRYQTQIRALDTAPAVAQQAAQRLAQALKQPGVPQSAPLRRLIAQFQQGKVTPEALKQLSSQLSTAVRRGGGEALTGALKHLAKTQPACRETVKSLLEGADEKLLHRESADGVGAKQEKPCLADAEPLVSARYPQQQDGESGSRHAPDREAFIEEDELEVTAARAKRSGDAAPAPHDAGLTGGARAVDADADTVALDPAAMRALAMVLPPAAATVDEAQAQRAAQHILQDNRVSLSSLVQVPLDGLLLQASTLGLKTFGDSASAISKTIKIHGDAQERLTNKKVADYREQLAKAQEQAQMSKKASFWHAIFSPITKLFEVIIKPVIDLIKKIPGIKEALDWIQENISEIALPLAIVSSLLCPMSLPMTLGLLAVTSVAAGFSIANKVMGDEAPEWLKTADRVGDMLAGIAMMACTMNMMGGMLGSVGGRIGQFFGSNTRQMFAGIMRWTQRIQAVTAVGDGVSQSVLGYKKAELQGDIGHIAATVSWDELQMAWLQDAQKAAASRLENVISRAATVAQSASQAIADTGSLRSRLAGSMV